MILKTRVTEITYFTTDYTSEIIDPLLTDQAGAPATRAQSSPVSNLFLRESLENYPKVKIRFANGLTIYGNQEDKPWSLKTSYFSNMDIDNWGFFAINDRTGLFSILGIRANSRFAGASSPTTYFLHSRDGVLLPFQSYATDGMVYLRNSQFPNVQNVSMIHATEFSGAQTFSPLLRSNTRLTLSANWQSQFELDLWIMDGADRRPILELFILPQHWFGMGENSIRITQRNQAGEVVREEVPHEVVESDGNQGVRLYNLANGNRYLISAPNPQRPTEIW